MTYREALRKALKINGWSSKEIEGKLDELDLGSDQLESMKWIPQHQSKDCVNYAVEMTRSREEADKWVRW